jgi:fucose permease
MGQGLVPFWLALGMLVFGCLFCWLYARHAARTPHPLLDLNLMRIATFRASVIGGALFRIAMGATAFLLPLLFQVGFGLTAFASGMLTFVTAIGAFLMKFTAPPILNRFGFRNVLVVNALISTVFVGGFALFSSATPHAVILAVLFVAGYFRSLQFSAVNTLVYADIAPPSMSQATSFASATLQLSLSLGVASAALTLEAEQVIRGNSAILVNDFITAFLVVGVIGALSAVIFWRLPRDAGSELTGKVAGPADPASMGRPSGAPG